MPLWLILSTYATAIADRSSADFPNPNNLASTLPHSHGVASIRPVNPDHTRIAGCSVSVSAAHYDSILQRGAMANAAVFADRDMRVRQKMVTDFDAVVNHHVGMQNRVAPDGDVLSDYAIRAHAARIPDSRGRRDRRRRVNARLRFRGLIEERDGPREIEVRITGNQTRQCFMLDGLSRENGARARILHPVGVFRVGEKSEMLGPACSIPATPVIWRSPGPESRQLSAAASSESFIAMPRVPNGQPKTPLFRPRTNPLEMHRGAKCARIKLPRVKRPLRQPMPINADKPHLWKADTRASVDQFNKWFMKFAPKAYRDTRKKTIESVEQGLTLTNDLTTITPEVIKANPGILPTLRMSTCPPLARDRLIGLADSSKNFVGCLEQGRLPRLLSPGLLEEHLGKISSILSRMLDGDIFPWLAEKRRPSQEERYRSSTIVADRLCGAGAEPIVRNAHESRQLSLIEKYLNGLGYKLKAHPVAAPITQMEPGTFSFRLNALVKPPKVEAKSVKIPIDVVIQPKKAKLPHLPVLIEAKAAGDFTNVNKRRKEEATKINQLKATYGEHVIFVLFLCGYFDAAYLGYEAAEGIDWIWEHRTEDLDQLGL